MSDTTENNPERVKILLEAANLITGQRQKDYGSPQVNFQRIADLWNIQIAGNLSKPITPRQVSEMMIQLKLARSINSPTRDTYVDIGGYAGIGGELADNEAQATPLKAVEVPADER